ncbi:hypothetical protein HQ533_06135 [Candidatus Woesearchaeota archaeon]|nr:hypothetical protein [Candidatus Woesearchaeota archaeon]
MALKFPESMDECVYFTRRTIDNGKAMAWVFKEECPKCHKALMGKPKDEKTGKAKIRAKEYVCPACNHTVEKIEYEETLTCNIQYTCPECMKPGEIQVPFIRKSIKGAKAVIFNCEKCDAKIAVTKKMKKLKE